MTFADIIVALRRQFHDYRYIVTNTYIFRHDWESDFFCISNSGLAIEVEVKVSLSDFMADFRKADKHRALAGFKTGYVIRRMGTFNNYTPRDAGTFPFSNIKVTPIEDAKVPNRFYYACPEGIIPVEKVPAYAGLIYCEGRHATIIKKAPLLHKGVGNYTKTLLDKFYWKCVRMEEQLKKAQ